MKKLLIILLLVSVKAFALSPITLTWNCWSPTNTNTVFVLTGCWNPVAVSGGCYTPGTQIGCLQVGGGSPDVYIVSINSTTNGTLQFLDNWAGHCNVNLSLTWSETTGTNVVTGTNTVNWQSGNGFLMAVGSCVPYSLDVVNGTGSGSYLAGATVFIAPNFLDANNCFASWTGTASSYISSGGGTYFVTMPAADIQAIANFAPCAPPGNGNPFVGTNSGGVVNPNQQNSYVNWQSEPFWLTNLTKFVGQVTVH